MALPHARQDVPARAGAQDFRNIECRDAVLTYDEVSYATDERGVPLTRWDGKTLKPRPFTGEMIPDEDRARAAGALRESAQGRPGRRRIS
jgi:hypothetical protein